MGAREIRIEEVAEAGNFLALRSEDPEKYFLNGGWTIQWNGDYRVAGTTFTYKRTGNWENLTSPGPTVEPVWIQVRSRISWWLGCVAGRMGGTELLDLLPSRAGLSCRGLSQHFPAIRGLGLCISSLRVFLQQPVSGAADHTLPGQGAFPAHAASS